MKKRKYGLPIASVVACMVSATFANAGPIRDRINDLEWCRDQYPRYPLLKTTALKQRRTIATALSEPSGRDGTLSLLLD